MESMKWRERLRRFLIANPKDRWGADPLFIALSVVLAVWVARDRDSILSGFVVAAFVMTTRELLFHLLVRRRRGRDSSD